MPVAKEQKLDAVYEPRCDKPKDREDSDLCEQRRMSKAAEEAVWWAAFQSKLGIAGFVAVLASLFFTGWAAWAAQKAASAAKEAVGIERAWMTYKGLPIGNVYESKIGGKRVEYGLRIPIVWINSGRSPALRTSFRREYRIIGLDDPIPTFDDERVVVDGAVCGPGQTIAAIEIYLDDEESALVRGQNARLIVFCRVTYIEIFNPKIIRKSTLCGEVTVTGGSVQEANGQTTPIAFFSMVGPQNSAD